MTGPERELTCREMADFVADYLDATLAAEERRLFDEHLAECPECVTYLRRYADTIGQAKDAYGDEPVPPGVPDDLVRAILAARPRRR